MAKSNRKRQANNFQDLSGKVFGKLTVLCRDGNSASYAAWKCRCECGRYTRVRSNSLKTGNTRSCGCLHEAVAQKFVANATKHMLSTTVECQCWYSIRQRCLCKTNKAYKYYGGRGIRICQRWLESAENFYADMGPRPSNKHSIERKDNDGDYCPENCVWAVQQDQVSNRRVTIRLTINGTTKTLTDWAREYGVKPTVARWRYHAGWSTELILKS